MLSQVALCLAWHGAGIPCVNGTTVLTLLELFASFLTSGGELYRKRATLKRSHLANP